MQYEVTNMRITKNDNSSIKALCDVVIGNEFVLKDVHIVQGKCGIFPSCPQRQIIEHGEAKYVNIYYPINTESRKKWVTAILSAYEETYRKDK